MRYFGILVGLVLVSCLEPDEPDPVVGPTFEEQLAIDVAAIDDYLSTNEIIADKHSSGIRFVYEVVGDGATPALTDNVTVKYTGTFLDGEVFDESLEGVEFPLAQLIQAWQIMIPLMAEGGKMTIYAPSVYCYGPVGTGAIPPNANLIFDIELVAVN